MVVALGSKKRMLLVHSTGARPAGHHRVVGSQLSSIDKSSESCMLEGNSHLTPPHRSRPDQHPRPMMAPSPAGRSIGRCPYSSQASTASEQQPRQRHSARPAPGGVVPCARLAPGGPGATRALPRPPGAAPRARDDRIASHPTPAEEGRTRTHSAPTTEGTPARADDPTRRPRPAS